MAGDGDGDSDWDAGGAAGGSGSRRRGASPDCPCATWARPLSRGTPS